MPDPTDLAGQSALVTGGGAGIGRAIGLELARRGAAVTIVGRRRERLDAVARDARGLAGSVTALPGDLTAPDFPARAADAVPKLDLLIHNAVAFPPYGDVESLLADEAARVHEVAVLAPLRLTAAFLGAMKQRRHGRIVFVGSIAASTGAARQTAYASAKSALHGLVRSLSLEAAPHGVTCNLVEPGLIETERVRERIPEATQRALVAATPMGRAGTPEEVAALVGFLCSRSAGYVTGAVIPVSGGLGLGLLPPQRP